MQKKRNTKFSGPFRTGVRDGGAVWGVGGIDELVAGVGG